MRPDDLEGFGPVGSNGPANLLPRLRDAALGREGTVIGRLLSEAAAALEAAREDAERLAFLAIKLVVEGFVGGEKHIYDYACDAAEESGRDEPSEADMLAGLRRMIDAAIDQALRKEARNG